MNTAVANDEIFASSSYDYMMSSMRMRPRGKINVLKESDLEYVKRFEFEGKNFTVNGKRVTERGFFAELHMLQQNPDIAFAINW